MKFDPKTLFEGINQHNERKERQRLVAKWVKTGLLKGLEGQRRSDMARLLENQVIQVLAESNALSTGGGALTSSGQVQGFSTAQFPVVRRVFGGLVANERHDGVERALKHGLRVARAARGAMALGNSKRGT